MLPFRRKRRQAPDRERIVSWTVPLTLRLAEDRDDAALRRLAGRDSRPLPPAPFLVGVRGGAIEAAISLASGELIADPFRRTYELAATLRAHAGEARLAPDAAASIARGARPAGEPGRRCSPTVRSGLAPA